MRKLRTAFLTLLLSCAAWAGEGGTGGGPPPPPPPDERGSIIGKNLWETFLAGGILMWPILASSIIGLAFIFERAVSLRQSVVVPPGVGKAVVDAARNGGVADAQLACHERPSALSRVLAAGLAVADRSREEVETAMAEAGEREQWHMDRFNRPLSIVSSVAPLLGLLGTVQGMIMAFDVVAQKGAMGDPRQLAAGVATALLTTFAGLTVAIPCYCFYHYYRDKTDRMIVQIEDSASHLVDALKGAAPAAAGQSRG
ncbi:MAG: MotA/TolQ/ExbB proton channel family protein [Planctomycetes bacterium]|nr:MotA/TolQ/ExbB proton channel family protein [Planctomycetota bacterium]